MYFICKHNYTIYMHVLLEETGENECCKKGLKHLQVDNPLTSVKPLVTNPLTSSLTLLYFSNFILL